MYIYDYTEMQLQQNTLLSLPQSVRNGLGFYHTTTSPIMKEEEEKEEKDSSLVVLSFFGMSFSVSTT